MYGYGEKGGAHHLPARLAVTSVVGRPGSRYSRRAQRGSMAAAVATSPAQLTRAGVANVTQSGIAGHAPADGVACL